MIVLDTHVLIWLTEAEERLGERSRRLADRALEEEETGVSAITFWEAAMLAVKKRIALGRPLAAWRESVLDLGIVEIPVSGDIGIAAVNLQKFHADPADRIIVATAQMRGATLITADDRILSWGGSLKRHDARV